MSLLNYFTYFVIIVLLFLSCSGPFPPEKVSFFDFELDYKIKNDSIEVYLINPIACPLRIQLSSGIAYLAKTLEGKTFLLPPYKRDTVRLPFKNTYVLKSNPFSYTAILGDPKTAKHDENVEYCYPFKQGKSSKILQGYHGEFSHTNPMQEYSIDFELDIGDTVCAARDGVVVGVIEDYTAGGNDRKYQTYANYLILYHDDGVLSQYVHLKENGSLVKLGDRVKRFQPVGLSGMTGFSTSPHLHFNVILPTDNNGISVPVNFPKMNGEDLKYGMIISH